MRPWRSEGQATWRTAFTAGLLLLAFAANAAQPQAAPVAVLDVKALPLGDGRISTEAKRGHVLACATQFRGGGAQHVGDWIQGDTWDATRKIWVQGEVHWSDARFTIEVSGEQRVLTGNALPVGQATGRFPIQRQDPAFQIDRNPNAIVAQSIRYVLPVTPSQAGQATCLPMGAIGVALNGVPIFNALDDAGRDAVAHEVQDRCHGHPQGRGMYHYHGPSDCVPGNTGNQALVGYALDGFGIFSGRDANGQELTNADLDACHGRVGTVLWNGQMRTMYHYVMTREYPYALGCYRGTPVGGRMQGQAGEGGPASRATQFEQAPQPRETRPSGPPRPPAAAIDACTGQIDGSACAFNGMQGRALTGQCRQRGGGAAVLACVPAGR
jgi:hypothetical protein